MSSIQSAGLTTLEIQDVGRRFGGSQALAHFDMTVQGGEFIALLGPSGCGKSTALNCLAGLLPLTSGRILIDGKRIDTLPPEKRDFGMVFQNYALFPHLTVAKNVAFGLTMRKLPAATIKTRVAEALALVRLEPHAGKLPGQLSGGQQQRVAIARAIATRPRLVLMDEPLSNLDAKLRIDTRAEIRKLHQMLGLTTIYVTHDQEEALSMADRLVVLRDGLIQQIDTPEQIHERPKNPYVAEFMGYRNQLHGHVVSAQDDVVGVRVGELVLNAHPVTPLTVGDPVTIAIRPDDLLPVGPARAVRDRNVLTATPTIVEYQGQSFAVELRGPEGVVLHSRVGELPPQPGEPVQLTVGALRALAYPSADAPGAPVESTSRAEAVA